MPAILKVDTARIIAVCDLSTRPRRSRQAIRQRLLHQEKRQTLRRCHWLRQLQRTPRQPGHRRRRHLYSRSSARGRCRRGPCRQRRLPPEARLAHHRRRPLSLRRRPIHWTHPPDRQPAALLEAVPPRVRTRSQRPHRRSQARRDRSPRRPRRRRPDADARACRLPIRCVARFNARRLLHPRPRHAPKRFRVVPAGSAWSSSVLA